MADHPQNYHIKILDPGDYALWDQFINETDRGTLFHSTAWAEVITTVFRRPYQVITAQKENQIFGGLILWPKPVAGLQMITRAPVTPYQGLVTASADSTKNSSRIAREHEISSALIHYLTASYQLIDFPLCPGIEDVRPYLWNGFRAEPHYTYTFPLTRPGQLQLQFSQALRRKLRQTGQQGLVTQESDDEQRLVELVVQSYHQHNQEPPVSPAHLTLLFRQIVQKRLGTIYYLLLAEKIIAGVLVLADPTRCYTLFAGIDDSQRRQFPTELMYTSFMEMEPYQGLLFDFLGADLPQFEQFKRSFGGQLQVYYQVSYVRNRWIGWLSELRRRQHMWQRRRRHHGR